MPRPKALMPQAATAMEVSRIFFIWQVCEGICSLNYFDLRRRNISRVVAPRPPKVIAVGSGTGFRTKFPSQDPLFPFSASRVTGGDGNSFTVATNEPVVPLYGVPPL